MVLFLYGFYELPIGSLLSSCFTCLPRLWYLALAVFLLQVRLWYLARAAHLIDFDYIADRARMQQLWLRPLFLAWDSDLAVQMESYWEK